MATTSRKILEKTVIASLFLLMLVFSLNNIRNWDIWWHLQAGQYIVNNGIIPRSDPFSYTSAGAPWVDLHWGFQVLAYTVYNSLGGTGLILFKTLLVLATLLLVFKTYTAKNCRFFGLALFFLTILIISHRLLVRPEVLSLLFLAIYLKVLWAYSEGRSKALYILLPLLQVPWVNMHGLFVLGLFALWAFILGEWMRAKVRFFSSQQDTARSDKDLLGLLSVGILSVLACLVNPYGVDGLLFPLTLFTRISGQAAIYSTNIGEFLSLFQPGTPWTILKVSYMTLLCVTACSFLLNWRNVNPTHLILCAGFAYLSVKSKRNINLFAVTAYPIVLYNLERGLLSLTRKGRGHEEVHLSQKHEKGKTQKDKRQFRESLLTGRFLSPCTTAALSVVLAVVLVTIFFAFTNRLFIMENKHKSFGLGAEMDFYPTVCIEWIMTNRPKGPVFNNLGLGGYLIHALYPDYKVFIDGRLEVHPETLYRRYTEAVDNPENKWDALQEGFGFGWAILSHSAGGTHRLIQYLYNRPDWELVSIDSAAVVFVETRESDNDFSPIDFEAWSPEIAISASINGFKGPLSCLENLFNRPTPWTLSMPFELFSLGNLFMTLDRPEKAAEIFQIAVERSPRLKALHNNLGLSCLRLGKWDEAIAAFKEAIDLAPRDAVIQSNLGVAYGQKGLTQKAISAFKRAATLDNDYEDAFSNLGAAYWQEGRLDEAIAAYKRAVLLRPDFAEHYYALALLYYKKGNLKDTTIYARRAKELGYAKADVFLSQLVQE